MLARGSKLKLQSFSRGKKKVVDDGIRGRAGDTEERIQFMAQATHYSVTLKEGKGRG